MVIGSQYMDMRDRESAARAAVCRPRRADLQETNEKNTKSMDVYRVEGPTCSLT